MKKIFILFFIASSLVTCKKAEKTFIKVNDNPLIEYYKIGDNIEIFSSDFKMGSEEELNEKAIKLIINGNYEDGEIKLLKALSINPNSSIVLNNLGNLKRQLKEFPKAIEYFNKAIILSDSTYYPSIINLGKIYGHLGEDVKAEKLYNHIIEKSNIEFLIGLSHYGLAKMYLDYGWFEKANLSISKSEYFLSSYNDFDSEIASLKLKIKTYK